MRHRHSRLLRPGYLLSQTDETLTTSLMARQTYPRSTVWYVETRPMNAGRAPEHANGMGSGVVVEIEELDEQDRSCKPKRIRKYLLTCAHLCRQPTLEGEPGWGPLLQEILCFPPDSKYQRTGPASRNSGQIPGPGVMLAGVSPHSPCHAAVGSVDAALRLPRYDWVLLDVQDPAFQKQPAARRWALTTKDKEFDIIGYPGGAALWQTGNPVESYVAQGFTQKRTPDEGMLKPEGTDETSNGMSGGGVFTSTGELAGIHCSSTQAYLHRGAVSILHIEATLKKRHLRPATPPWWERLWELDFMPAMPRVRIPRFAWLATLILLLVGGLAYALLGRTATTIDLHLKVGAKAEGQPFDQLLAGLAVTFKPDPERQELQVEPAVTDAAGQAVIRVHVPHGASSDHVSGYVVCENAPGAMQGHAPLILEPFGMVAEGLNRYKSTDVLDLNYHTRPPTLRAQGLRQWKDQRLRALMSTAPETLAQAAGMGTFTPQTTSLAETLASSKILLARQGIQEEEFEDIANDWAEGLLKERPILRASSQSPHYPAAQVAANNRSLASVGAIYGHLDGNASAPPSLMGSAVVVGKDLILTASYVMDLRRENGFEIAFAEETTPLPPQRLKLGSIVWKDTERRLCLVQVQGVPPSPLPLVAKLPSALALRPVYVAGYPAADSRLPPELKTLFNGSYGRKCVMPGELQWESSFSFDEPKEEAGLYLHHDATTSGGTGGGPLMDAATQGVLGIHVQGLWDGQRKSNQASSLASLAQDTAFRDLIEKHGGRFVEIEASPLPADPSPPAVSPASLEITVPYDADFLGVPVPLPASAAAATDIRLDYVHYTLVIAPQRRMARYAACNVDRSQILRMPRTGDRWFVDSRLPADQQLDAGFYNNNDWDRGHLCRPSSLRWGDYSTAVSAYQSAYFLTHSTPQHASFNRGQWTGLERDFYDDAHPDSKRLIVFAGPVFRDTDIVEKGVPIPRSYWMLALYQNEAAPAHPFTAACLADQYELQPDGGYEPLRSRSTTGSMATHAVSVRDIEQLTGLTFSLPAP